MYKASDLIVVYFDSIIHPYHDYSGDFSKLSLELWTDEYLQPIPFVDVIINACFNIDNGLTCK